MCVILCYRVIFSGAEKTETEKTCKSLDNLSNGNLIMEMEQIENVLDKVFLKITSFCLCVSVCSVYGYYRD